MYTIGEFAALGRVSVRMLRHYDAIGLLRPADVDARNGYRRYDLQQLDDLLRVTELRDLGCSLDDAAAVLGAADRSEQLRIVLDRRRQELRATIAADQQRLTRLERRLSVLEGNPAMSASLTTAIAYRSIEPVTVYATSGIASGTDGVGAVVGAILPPLLQALQQELVDFREPGVFWYENVPGTDDLRVWVSWIAGSEPRKSDAWEVLTLPAIERAAVTSYRGDMTNIDTAWREFTEAIIADGAEPFGGCREVYLESEPLPESQWLTELVQQVR